MVHFAIVDLALGHLNSPEEKRVLIDAGALASAINLPRYTYGQKDLYPTIYLKAAALLRSLIKNHPFLDGNKRTALLCVAIFLEDNGYELVAEEGELLRFVLRIAKTRRPNLHKIKGWLDRHGRRQGTPAALQRPFLAERVRKAYDQFREAAIKSWFGSGETKPSGDEDDQPKV